MSKTLLTIASVRAALKSAAIGERLERHDGLVQGLVLRAGPKGVRWTVRMRTGGQNRRWDLGLAVVGDRDVGPTQICLQTARLRAQAVRECVRQRGDVGRLLRQLAGMHGTAARGPDWRWEAARTAYLADVQRTRRSATHDDYRKVLGLADLIPLAGRPVAEITRHDIAAVVRAVHARGVESQAEHVLRVVKAMWKWLADPSRSLETGVLPGALADLRAPERTRVERGEHRDADDEGLPDGVPEPLALGRLLAVARSGALREREGLAIQLLLGSVQRRRAIVSANAQDFRTCGAAQDEIWLMPPYVRKSGRKRRSTLVHAVPLVGWAAEAVRRLDRLAGEFGWLFLARPRGRRAATRQPPKTPHSDPKWLNDLLAGIPGVAFPPHAVRRAFATHGRAHLRFGKGEARVVLDHLEGVELGDVTEEHYELDRQMARKREMLAAWCAWLDEQAAAAVAADPVLADREALRELLFRHRRGEAAWAARLARRRKHGSLEPFQRLMDAEPEAL